MCVASEEPRGRPDGSAIEIEECDVHIGVHGLIAALLPAMLPARVIAWCLRAGAVRRRPFRKRKVRGKTDTEAGAAKEEGRLAERPIFGAGRSA